MIEQSLLADVGHQRVGAGTYQMKVQGLEFLPTKSIR